MDRTTLKQNILVKHGNRTIKLQFEFCPKCQYYESCYDGSAGNGPSLLNPECLVDYENGVFDDNPESDE